MSIRRTIGFLSISPIAVFIALNLSILLQKYVDVDKLVDRVTVPNLSNGEVFDFIIVGAGSSGSTLASRLSEKYRVLLLEAGGHPSPLISVPLFSQIMSGQPAIDWRYRTVPQRHAAFGLNDNVTIWGAGKGLGGTSLINAQLYLRENVQGFNKIAEKTGDSMWKLENILRYYKDLEDYNGGYQKGNKHGTGGEISVETPETVSLIDNLLRAGQELGYKVRDPNDYGPLTEGFSSMDFFQKFGRRSDAYTGSLSRVVGKSNLVLRKFSFVRNLLMNKTRAHGVEYERYNTILKAFARMEVILCAGTIQSPKLLMLAGIGPKDHLKQIGIPLRVDLPVGNILEDKYGALLGPFVVDEGKSFREDRDITLPRLLRWFFLGNGPLASGGPQASHQIYSSFAKIEGKLEVPDIHTYVAVSSPGEVVDYILKAVLNYKPDLIQYVNSIRGRDAFFQLVTIGTPYSRGTLRLADRNPNSYPIIDPNYLSDKRDLYIIVEGLKFAVKLVEETSAFKEINAKLVEIPYPGCKQFFFKSDEYFTCLTRHLTVSALKYSGTTPIGKDKSDPHAVVDSRFRVLGVDGLRIVGGSVLRVSSVSVNDVTCRMLGVLASDVIKEDWRR